MASLRLRIGTSKDIKSLKERIRQLELENAQLKDAMAEASTQEAVEVKALPLKLPSSQMPKNGKGRGHNRNNSAPSTYYEELVTRLRPLSSRRGALDNAPASAPPASSATAGSSVNPSPLDLPAEASNFVGTWTQVGVENYDAFLKEVVGLGYMTRKIALRIKPRPTWWIDDPAGSPQEMGGVAPPPGRGAVLFCRVECFGAKPIFERYTGGELSFEAADANVDGVMWQTRTWWEAGGVLCSERRSESQNDGRPITVRRAVHTTGSTVELVVTQTWGPGKVFTQTLRRDVDGAETPAATTRRD